MTSPTTEQIAAEKEAQEYWGYLFQPDKTGTSKLKKLLRGLHQVIGSNFEQYDSSDLTPSQLAHFYRELNGNYDPLFLQTPPATIAFIYKNLGCLHSLQPPRTTGAKKRVLDPSVPALKVEGWIMWETIQLLLGPDEHAGFLMNAVKKWDVKDPDTGDTFPNILPRSALPTQPDAHMVAWYEGVSERLRREAEDEQSMRITAVEEEPRKQIEFGEQRHHRKHEHHASRPDTPVEDEAPDSRRSAIAYFRNPLFRKEDGRPGVVRRESRHPTLVSRGKSAATSVGHVMRSVASPSLWDGGSSKDKDREREREREKPRDRSRRRRSLPHHGHGSDVENDEGTASPRLHPRHAAHQSRRNSQNQSPASELDTGSDHNSRHSHGHHHHQRKPTSPYDRTVRHSKSHDPTSSPKDYFPPYEQYQEPRRGSYQSDVQSSGASTPVRTPMSTGSRPGTSEGPKNDIVHAGFMPTASPLFATTIARNESKSGYYGQPAKIALARDRQNGDRRSFTPAQSQSQSPQRASSVRRPEDYRSHSRNSPPPAGAHRSKVTRFETPEEGVHGRQYIKEGPWR